MSRAFRRCSRWCVESDQQHLAIWVIAMRRCSGGVRPESRFQETRWGWRLRRSIVDIVVFPQPATVLLTLRPGCRCRRRLRCRRLSIVGCWLSMLEGRGGSPEGRVPGVFLGVRLCLSPLLSHGAKSHSAAALATVHRHNQTPKVWSSAAAHSSHFVLLQQKKKGRWNPKLVSSCVAPSLSLQAISRMRTFLECDQPTRISRR